MNISNLKLTNSLSSSLSETTYKPPVTPVAKVNKVEQGEVNRLLSDYKTMMNSSYTKAYSSTEALRYNENNPYEASRKTIDYSIVSGMNFDASI